MNECLAAWGDLGTFCRDPEKREVIWSQLTNGKLLLDDTGVNLTKEYAVLQGKVMKAERDKETEILNLSSLSADLNTNLAHVYDAKEDFLRNLGRLCGFPHRSRKQ